ELVRLDRTHEAAGRDSIERGEVAAAVLNGGMATRFGGVVKGIVEAVDGRSFLEWKLLDAEHAGIPMVVMNSFATDEATREFVSALEVPPPLFFTQSVSLRLNPDGSLFVDADGTAAPYAPGHGDFVASLRREGILEELRARGVRLLLLSNVDNLAARVDPAVVGAHLAGGRPVTLEVTEKAPGDTGGAPALVDGQPMAVEGFRFPSDFDQDQIPVFATNCFVFDVDVLDRDYDLTWLYVEKEIAGRRAVQLEQLVNEVTRFQPTTFVRVPRTGLQGRFFPVKTPADLEAAREPLRELLLIGMKESSQDPREHPSFDRAKWFLLAEAVSDVQGIWEPLWLFRGGLDDLIPLPRLDESGQQLWAEVILRELYEAGLIAFFRSSWVGDQPADAENDALRLDAAGVEAALASDHWRTVPVGDTHIWFTVTPQGEETYYALPPQDASTGADTVFSRLRERWFLWRRANRTRRD
ncbi:MAG: UTP--glucose-1-phosphate uridylyltransferase, partial [Actinomycetota bacterium]|nr:UTP--glucose-1-phosphate uridylyltransferase [Actinomycetota bacterium]